MIPHNAVNWGKAGHSRIGVVDVLDILSLVRQPNRVVHNVSSEECKRGIRSNLLYRGIHAILQADWSIAFRVAVWSSWIFVVTGRFSRSVWSAANWFCTVIAGSSLIERINVNVAEMHHLDWKLSAHDWPTGWRLW